MLATSADRVWAAATTFTGINAELRPLMRMTHPRGLDRLDLSEVRPGTRLFRSYLLLAGVVPVDYDDITLVQVGPGRRFLERSRMLSATVWSHEREVRAVGQDGCEVIDTVSYRPRWPVLGLVLDAAVPRIFAHRHRRLRALFGAAVTEPSGPGDPSSPRSSTGG